MRETLGELNIQPITTSPYNPQNNAKVERFHKTLADVLAKLAEHNWGNCDLFLTQALAAVRFSINETTQFSPYYLVYGRDIVLPIDNLLRPRKKYLGEDRHRINLEQQHKIFTQVRRRIRRAQKRRNDRMNKNREEVSFKIGDPVCYKIHLRDGNAFRVDKLNENRKLFCFFLVRGCVSEWCEWGRLCSCHRHYAGRVEGPSRGLGTGDGVS